MLKKKRKKDCFPLKNENKASPFPPFLCNIVLKVLARAIKQGKETRHAKMKSTMG